MHCLRLSKCDQFQVVNAVFDAQNTCTNSSASALFFNSRFPQCVLKQEELHRQQSVEQGNHLHHYHHHLPHCCSKDFHQIICTITPMCISDGTCGKCTKVTFASVRQLIYSCFVYKVLLPKSIAIDKCTFGNSETNPSLKFGHNQICSIPRLKDCKLLD